MEIEHNGLRFDYRLGYVRANTPFSGFDVIGEDGAPRILLLGGYTTTNQATSKQTWADCLYDLFKADRRPVQIINGDTDGYTSAQEMMMCIRDGVLLKPDAVICLSGFYNFAYKLGFVKKDVAEFVEILQNHSFTNYGQLEFYQSFTSRFGLGKDTMYYGEKTKTSAWQYWLEHTDMIHCICEEFEIKHMTLLQPSMFSGEYKPSNREKDTLAKLYGFTDIEMQRFNKDFRKIYQNLRQGVEDCPYIANISDLFDNENDIYVDACHTDEKYTIRIAEAIYKQINTVLQPAI